MRLKIFNQWADRDNMIERIEIDGVGYIAEPISIDHDVYMFNWCGGNTNMNDHCGLYGLFGQYTGTVLYGFRDESGEWVTYKCPKFNSDGDLFKYERDLIELYEEFGDWREVFECISV